MQKNGILFINKYTDHNEKGAYNECSKQNKAYDVKPSERCVDCLQLHSDIAELK